MKRRRRSRREPRAVGPRAQVASAPLSTPAPTPAKERPEAWAWCAFGVLFAFLIWIVYLGARPGGRTPLVLYGLGPIVLSLGALLVLLFAAAWSATHRPFLQRRRIFPLLCLAVVIGAPQFPFPYPSSREGHPSTVCFRLPVEVEWTVVWGGESSDENRLAAFSPDRRWGLDLIVTRDERSHAGGGDVPADFHAFDRRVLAPAEGTVVRVHDQDPDGPMWIRSQLEPYGNYVAIEVGEREYVFLAHLRHGSLRVGPGDRVRAGEEIARVGSSGWSGVTPEPHLAIHLQDTPELRAGEGIPWSFCGYLADGVHVERGSPHGGIGRDGAFLGQKVQAGGADVR